MLLQQILLLWHKRMQYSGPPLCDLQVFITCAECATHGRRRWFTADRDDGRAESAGGGSQPAASREGTRDVETGHSAVVSAADEAAASTAADSRQAPTASRPGGADARAASSDSSRQGLSEITPAPEPSQEPASSTAASTSTGEVLSANSASIAAALGNPPPERSSGSVTTGAGIVASLGQLLGLAGGGGSGKSDAASDVETGDSEAEKQAQAGRHLLRGLSRSNSGSFPMCLICLEPFTEGDFNVITSPPFPPLCLSYNALTVPLSTNLCHQHAVLHRAPCDVR